jgi:hypothetical protein
VIYPLDEIGLLCLLAVLVAGAETFVDIYAVRRKEEWSATTAMIWMSGRALTGTSSASTPDLPLTSMSRQD